MLACIKYLPLLLLQRPATTAKRERDTVDRRVYYMLWHDIRLRENATKSQCSGGREE